jgi:hypothetical protein
MSSRQEPRQSGDPDDPYSPPRSEIGSVHPSLRAGAVPFELSSILAASWSVYKAGAGTCVAITWTVMGLIMTSQYLQGLVAHDLAPDPADRLAYFLAQFGSFFAGWVFNTWVTIGQSLALLGVARNAAPAYPRLFQGFPFLLTTLLAGLVFVLVLGVIAAVFMIWVPILGGILGRGSGGVILVRIIGLVCTVVVAFLVATRLSQYHLMIVDEGAGVMDSLRYSWQATRHRVSTLILVWMLLILINIAGFLACVVGLLVTIPFTNVLLIVTFLSLTNQPIGIEKPKDDPGVEFLE